jgi:hypothetical protein
VIQCCHRGGSGRSSQRIFGYLPGYFAARHDGVVNLIIRSPAISERFQPYGGIGYSRALENFAQPPGLNVVPFTCYREAGAVWGIQVQPLHADDPPYEVTWCSKRHHASEAQQRS